MLSPFSSNTSRNSPEVRLLHLYPVRKKDPQCRHQGILTLQSGKQYHVYLVNHEVAILLRHLGNRIITHFPENHFSHPPYKTGPDPTTIIGACILPDQEIKPGELAAILASFK